MRVRDAFQLSLKFLGINREELSPSFFIGSRRDINSQVEKLSDENPFLYFAALTKTPDDLLTEEMIQEFLAYFKNRWELIRQTHKSYWYSYDSHSSRFCWALACEIAATSYVNLHPLEILMPTLNLYNEIDLIHLKESEEKADEEIAQEFAKMKEEYYAERARNPHAFKLFEEANDLKKIHKKIIYKHKLQLSQIVLSDDDKYPIDVFKSLNSSEEDGLLKHTNKLIDAKPVALSETEIKRVQFHSMYASEYYDQIYRYLNFQTKSGSAGAGVFNLIVHLRHGGERGGRGGNSYRPGPDASVGVEFFYNFLKKFSPGQRRNIYNTQSNLLGRVSNKFEICWLYLILGAADGLDYDLQLGKRLILPQEELEKLQTRFAELVNKESFNKSTPCVELIADDIEDILNFNKDWFDGLYPPQLEQAQELNLSSEKKILEVVTQKLSDYLQDPFARRLTNEHAYEKAHERLALKVIPSCIKDLASLEAFLANVYGDSHIEVLRILGDAFPSFIKTGKELGGFLNVISLEAYSEFIREILGSTFLVNLIRDFADLKALLSSVKMLAINELLLQTMTSVHLHSLIPTLPILKDCIETLTKNQCVMLIKAIHPSYVKFLVTNEEDTERLFSQVSSAKKSAILEVVNLPDRPYSRGQHVFFTPHFKRNKRSRDDNTADESSKKVKSLHLP